MDGLTMDVGKITVLRWMDHTEAIVDPDVSQRDKVKRWAELFANIIVECPPAWGNPGDPETYLNLKEITEWEPLIQMFWDRCGEERKKVSKPPTTA